MTAGEILAKIIREQEAGEDTTKLSENLRKATCEFFSRPGTKVTCGEFEAANGEPVTRTKSGR